VSWTILRSVPGLANRQTARADAGRAEPWTEFGRELDRSRRFSRPLTLLRFEASEGSPGLDLVADVARSLRTIDLVWLEDDALLTMLAETGPEGCDAVRRRVAELARQRGLSVHARRASFPADGVTAGALLDALHNDGATPGSSHAPIEDIQPRTPSVVPVVEEHRWR
jgi:hypothetical protein